MKLVVCDTMARWFLRVQATLVMCPMAALPPADRDARAAFLWAAMATDVARWALSRFRWPPLVLGGALVCCALALCVAAIAESGAPPLLPTPSPDRAGAPLFVPNSGFLSSVEAAGGGGFLFSLVVAMFMGQAGVFLMFAGERSEYLRRFWTTKRPQTPEWLGPCQATALMALFTMLFLFASMGVLGIFFGLIVDRAPASPAAALDSVAWRIATTRRFLIPSAIVVATTLVTWAVLNAIAFKRELLRKAKSMPAGQRVAAA